MSGIVTSFDLKEVKRGWNVLDIGAERDTLLSVFFIKKRLVRRYSFFNVSCRSLVSNGNDASIVVRVARLRRTSTSNTDFLCLLVPKDAQVKGFLGKKVIKSLFRRLLGVVPVNEVVAVKLLELKSEIAPGIIGRKDLRIAHRVNVS